MQREDTKKYFELKQGGYSINFPIECLGTGGSSCVFQGEYINKKNKKPIPVAIKRSKSPRHIERIEHERKMLLSISRQSNENSKYIIKYYGSRFYRNIFNISEAELVMEYASTGDLKKWIKTAGVVSWNTKLYLVQGIARGIYFLHSINILHHDINGGNILLSNENGELIPKISDFGFSIKNNAKKKYGVGTIPYIPPELLIKSEPFSDKSDIYSLGLVFWEIAALQLAFKKIDDEDALLAYVGRCKLRECFPKDCPPEFWYLINGMWQQNPADRPAMKQILDLLLAGLNNITSEFKQFTLSCEMHNLAVEILNEIFNEATECWDLTRNPWKTWQKSLNFDKSLKNFSDTFSKILTDQFRTDYLLNLSDFEKSGILNAVSKKFKSDFESYVQCCDATDEDFEEWLIDIFEDKGMIKNRIEWCISLGVQNWKNERDRKYFAVKQVLGNFSVFKPLKEAGKLKEIISVSLDMKCSR